MLNSRLRQVFRTSLCFGVVAVSWAVAMLSSCSSAKYIPDNEYLLQGVEVRTDDKDFDAQQLQQYIRQKGNSRWFSIFKIPLGVYAMAGNDSTKWINRTLRNIGEQPVLYDTLQAALTCNDLLTAMQNMGYMNAKVDHVVKVKGKKLKAIYNLHPGNSYVIRFMKYNIEDENINRLLTANDSALLRLHNGSPFTINGLDAERSRLTSLLLDNGYYKFHKEYIRFEADTMRGSRLVDVTMHLMRYRDNATMESLPHPLYTVRNVDYVCLDSTTAYIRKNILRNATAVEPGKPYSASAVQRTYVNFSRLHAVKSSNLRFTEVPGTQELDCTLQYGVTKPSTISFQPEGTNTAGDLGAAASVTYQNRNLFHGSEMLSVQLRGAFEAISKLEGYQNENYMEYGMEAKIAFPRFVTMLLSDNFKRNVNATSELMLSFNMQNRPEFHRRVLTAGWRYRWTRPRGRWSYKWDAIDLNFIYMPSISQTFKQQYLDNANSRNVILRYNYEDLFVMRTGMGINYNDGVTAVRTNIETGGNILNAAAELFKFNQNSDGQYTFFRIAYAQYVKGDVDFTRVFNLDEHNSLVLHAGLGIAYPYGNSTVLPFEKRYFSGGANSVRGWSVRGLGPGSFKGNNGAIDFINQTGDMKLDLNVEYRTHLFWKFNGALFIDGGNIWTLREYSAQPGGQFKVDKFYKQIAVAYGLGVRLNFDYFVLRFDMGMKAINPAYEDEKEHYAIAHPQLKRDFSFHFAVGLPF